MEGVVFVLNATWKRENSLLDIIYCFDSFVDLAIRLLKV